MRFLHTMLRVRDLDAALHFYCKLLGLEEVRRRTDEKNKYTLVFLAAPEDAPAAKAALEAGRRDAPMVELTYNWDTEDYGEARYLPSRPTVPSAAAPLLSAAARSSAGRASARTPSCRRAAGG